MRKVRVIAVIAVATLAGLLSGAQAALAQVSGDSSEIPENAPKNWAVQFVGEPLLLLGAFAILACGVVYAWRMVRLRYPRG